jgi:hypothetical protein
MTAEEAEEAEEAAGSSSSDSDHFIDSNHFSDSDHFSYSNVAVDLLGPRRPLLGSPWHEAVAGAKYGK